MPKIHAASTLTNRKPTLSSLSAPHNPTPSTTTTVHTSTASSAQNSPFLKQLASSSSLTRAKALDHLRQYLRSHTSLTPLDHLKLWKGLFYSVWHSDRPRAQQALARDLAALIALLPTAEATVSWLDAFWETMAREWAGIPALRMDKFLFLCRLYVRGGFAWCARGEWDEGRIEALMGIMEKCPLSSEVERAGLTNGLRFHVLDVWADEVEVLVKGEIKGSGKADGEEEVEEDASDVPVEELLAPVRRLKGVTRDKIVRKRCDEVLEDERVKKWLGVVDAPEEEDDE